MKKILVLLAVAFALATGTMAMMNLAAAAGPSLHQPAMLSAQ
jgi:hypothetical protein